MLRIIKRLLLLCFNNCWYVTTILSKYHLFLRWFSDLLFDSGFTRMFNTARSGRCAAWTVKIRCNIATHVTDKMRCNPWPRMWPTKCYVTHCHACVRQNAMQPIATHVTDKMRWNSLPRMWLRKCGATHCHACNRHIPRQIKLLLHI